MVDFKRNIRLAALIVALAAGTGFGAMAQETGATESKNEERKKEDREIVTIDLDRGVQIVQVLPVFLDGGEKGMYELISKNLKYPKNSTTEGRVFVSFLVDTDGTLKDPVIMKSLAPEFDKEAIRVIQLLDKWDPARSNGEKVAYRYILPVNFKIPEK